MDSPSNEKFPVVPSPKHGWRFHAAFVCICIVNLVCAVDATALSVSLPIISQKLGGTAMEAFWSGTSFLLTSTVFQPTWASFSHVFGRRSMILSALTLFTAGALICALANNFTVLLLGRSIQGAGGGGIIALSYVIMTDLVTLRERGKWFGFISMMWAVGSVSGPIVGGAFAERRWIFWINLPFCGLTFVMIPWCLKLQYKSDSFLAKLKQIDWIGSAAFVGSITSFLIPITWGGVMYSWTDWRTLVPLLLGTAGLVGFLVYSKYVPAQPLIKGSIFSTRTAIVSYLGTLLHGAILWSLLYYLPLYYEAAKSMSPIMAGVALFPQTFTVGPSSVIVGLAITHTGRYRWAIWAGWLFTTLGLGLLTLLTPSSATYSWILLNLVSGLGLGVLYPAMSFAIQAAAPANADIPFAAAMFSFFRAFGQAVGVALGGVVFQNQLRRRLRADPLLAPNAAAYSADAAALVQLIKSLPAHQALLKARLVAGYVDALRIVWAVMCGLAGVALLASLMTKDLSLDRALETEQGFCYGERPVMADEDVVADERVSK